MTDSTPAATRLTPQTARQLAHDAYLYAYPLVENYHSIYQWAIDSQGDQYKGPINHVNNVARVFGPQDTGVVTPNSDTPYSYLIMDLRAEPLVVTLPPVEPDRYYSLQVVDLYTHNVAYPGTREDGNGGGDFLIAGPAWTGTPPAGMTRVIRVDTDLAFSQFRTQLRDPSDLAAVMQIQAGYAVRPLSTYVGQPAPPRPPSIAYPPIARATIEPDLFVYANFLLQFCPVLPSEQALRARFAQIGVRAGAPWPPIELSSELQAAIAQGQADGRRLVAQTTATLTTSIGLFGTRAEMAGKYLERACAAKIGLYGNSAQEAVYPAYQVDASGHQLDSGRYDYLLRFAPGQLPPVQAFWSLTMYDGTTRYLVANPLERYLINTAMLPELTRDADGGLTLYLQHEHPGPAHEPNWLPAPNGPMFVVMRLYLPEPTVIDGTWTAPPIRRAPE